MSKEKKKEIKTLGKIVISNKQETKKPVPIKRKIPEKKNIPKPIQQQAEPAQFKRIALEELMNKDADIGADRQGTRWIRVEGEKKEEKKETAIYDIGKSKDSYFNMKDSYSQTGSGGDYSMPSGNEQTPTFQNNNEQNQGFNQMNQAKAYDVSSERDLKKEKDRRGGVW
jgi:hypothetical protein